MTSKPAPQDILIVSATTFEINPLLDYLSKHWTKIETADLCYQNKHIKLTIAICGIGMMATSHFLSKTLTQKTFDFAIQLGIAGAYPHPNIKLGSLVNVLTDRVADLGAYNNNGDFLNIATMGLNDSSADIIPQNIPQQYKALFEQLINVEGLSVNSILGNAQFPTKANIESTYPLVESMEGAAFHYCCREANIPFVQIRTVSNWVEPRDKSKWQMALAIDHLNTFAINFLENL